MKKVNLIIVSLFAVFYSYGQKDAFERELNRFRFSLHKELEKYDDEKVYKLDFNKGDSLLVLIDNFIAENTDSIKTYRKTILESYEHNPDFTFDSTEYERIDCSEINNSLNSPGLDENVPLYKLLWINPVMEVSTFKTIYLSQKKGVVELAKYNAKTSIASSLIKTYRINKKQWEIWDNAYDMVGKFIYDIDKGRVIQIEIFERKPKANTRE